MLITTLLLKNSGYNKCIRNTNLSIKNNLRRDQIKKRGIDHEAYIWCS